jgi:hypothetical protein
MAPFPRRLNPPVPETQRLVADSRLEPSGRTKFIPANETNPNPSLIRNF